jgi:enamine deaminase RidA (YjgF/YER057c/UK114 family)
VKISHANPDATYSTAARGYSQIVTVECAKRIVFVSGQLPFDRDGALVGKDDIEAQARRVFENIRACLAEVGADLRSVVKMHGFVTNVQDFPPLIRKVRAEFFGTTSPPASMLVEVPRFAHPDVLIEIDATAVIDW